MNPSLLSLSALLLAMLMGDGAGVRRVEEPRTPPVKDAVAPAKAIELFNGRDLEGWTAYFNDKSTDPSKAFSAAGGVLTCVGQPIGYIVTKQKYTNFELELDWRFDPAKGAGNSGVLLRVQDTDEVWPKSMEAQLQSESAGDIWNIGDFAAKVDPARTNGRHTTKLHPTNERSLGEWNHYRIVLDHGKLELYVNDLLQNTATDVAELPGRIALQSEGAFIQWRNIRLTPR